jgi:hypothetical protein
MLFVFCSGLVRKLFANYRIKPGQFPNEGRRKGEGKAKERRRTSQEAFHIGKLKTEAYQAS